jgi:hypothetical protein
MKKLAFEKVMHAWTYKVATTAYVRLEWHRWWHHLHHFDAKLTIIRQPFVFICFSLGSFYLQLRKV